MFPGSARIDRLQHHAERLSHGLNSSELSDAGWIGGIAENRRSYEKRRDLSFSSSSHFPLKLYSKIMNPVTLPPGCPEKKTARLDTAGDCCAAGFRFGE
jgi:hypothetical protein